MKPKEITIFIISVLLVLFVVTFLSGQYKTSQGAVKEGILMGNTIIKFPTSDIMLKSSKQENSKASQILHDITQKKQEKSKIIESAQDSIDSVENQENIFLANKTEGRIYYPDNATDFISKLKQKLNQPNCQIIHYGDSQIEGDRITVYVRNRFQALFGGGGPGFIPIKIAYHQNSVNIQTSSNWLRFASFDRNMNKNVPHRKYGLYATLSRFTDYNPADTITVKKASFTIRPSTTAYNRLRKFTKFGLHYGNCTHKTKITVYQNGSIIRQDSLKTDGDYHNFKIDFSETPKEIKVELEGLVSPDFYGITLDEAKGVRMDNVAMRGEAGRIFTRLNHENFRQMSVERKPDIFIFQFGGNTVPYIREEKQITDYVYSLMQNIKWVKRSNPNASVIVIGPGDMSIFEKGKMITYPFLITLNEKMKEECLANGVAFWSIYEAMGGENSMVTWVEKDMAASDYVHLKPKGTQIISEMFFEHLHNDILATE
ncbi:MAG: lipase [Capnocytophaga sp.]|nr:lipase [Capnocytophaga sp.]